MPMLDAYIPEGALDPTREKQLMSELTDLLLKWEGADPMDAVARSIAWIFLHRPAANYVAGELAMQPRYRFVINVPEGQLDDKRRKGMVVAMTKAVLDAEPKGRERDASRIWVFTQQIPEGTWGGGGHIVRLADIATMVTGDREKGKAHAKKRLALVKAEREVIFS